MLVITEGDRSKDGEEKPARPAISKPEDQIYQKLHLRDYLRELYEADEKESEILKEKKKE